MLTMLDITDKLPFQTSVGIRALPSIRYAVVHHDAILAPDVYEPIARYVAEAKYHISRGFGHLAYHVKIARNGVIYQCEPFAQVGYHAGNYPVNLASIGICLDGDFSKQSPSAEQITSLNALMHSLSTEHPEMPRLLHGGFWAHADVRLTPTFCPGPNIRSIVKAYRNGGKD